MTKPVTSLWTSGAEISCISPELVDETSYCGKRRSGKGYSYMQQVEKWRWPMIGVGE